MPEIQDLTLRRDRGLAALNARFDARRDDFDVRLRSEAERLGTAPIGIRATLAPTSAPLYLRALHGNPAFVPPMQELRLVHGEQRFPLQLPSRGYSERPILGGVRYTMGSGAMPMLREAHRDGLVEVTLMDLTARRDKSVVYPEWVIGVTVHALLLANQVRRAAGSPDAAYGLEVEASRPGDHLPVTRWGGYDFHVVGPIDPNPLYLPRLRVSDTDSFSSVVQWVNRDLFNAAGVPVDEAAYSLDIPADLL